MSAAPGSTVVISARGLRRALGFAVASLVGAHLVFQVLRFGFGHDWVFGLAPLFDLDLEQNFPSWYSAAQLLGAALLLALIARRERAARGWHGLAVGFVLLSADETVGLHERLVAPLRLALGATGGLHFTWVIAGAVVVLLVGLAYVPFLRALPAPTRRRCLLAASLYVGGALGMEVPGGWAASTLGVEHVVYATMATIEESLELVGVAIFVDALARHLERERAATTIHWR